MKETINVFLSFAPNPSYWGRRDHLNFVERDLYIHLTENDPIDTIQIVARKISKQNIRGVFLSGKEWNVKRCWKFWKGFWSAKEKREIIWPISLSKKEIHELQSMEKSVSWVRNTINAPSNSLNPEQLVESTIDLLLDVAEKSTITYKVIKSKDLLHQGYVGIYSIGKSSENIPVLLILDFDPKIDPQSSIDFCLVGKGITFDTGGYCLKSSYAMKSMKSDMGGAAILVGALALSIQLGLSKKVRLILCCAENSINGRAIKPGDIIRYRNGKSIEVIDSDAEGRLLLADGLIEASLSKPNIIIDCATLTGSAKIALGEDYHAIFSLDEQIVEKFLSISEEENEHFWRLPLSEIHRKSLSSDFADIGNIERNRSYTAGASTAAAFLSFFVEDYQKNWIHIDSSAIYRETETEKWSIGSTGEGVQTIAKFLLSNPPSLRRRR